MGLLGVVPPAQEVFQRALGCALVGVNELARLLFNLGAALGVLEQFQNALRQRVRISNLKADACLFCHLGNIAEVVGVGSEKDGLAVREGLEQVLTAKRGERAAHDRHIAHRIQARQLAEGVHHHNLRVLALR